MSQSKYLDKEKISSIKNKIQEICAKVIEQNNLEETPWTFKFKGDTKWDLLKYDENAEYINLDVEIEVNKATVWNDNEKVYFAVAKALDSILVNQYKLDYCKREKEYLTFTLYDNNLKYKCYITLSLKDDFEEIDNNKDANLTDAENYMVYDKNANPSCHEKLFNKVYNNLDSKINWLKENHYWEELKDSYLKAKNSDNNKHNFSRFILANTVNALFEKYKNK